MHNLQPAMYNMAQTFGLPNLPASAVIEGRQGAHPAIPPRKDNHVFQLESLRDLTAFWQSGFVALKLQGDPGTGKTSLISQWHARLGLPLYLLPCTPGTEASRLIGHMVPTKEGTLVWADGPLVKAAREGSSVLLDEYNNLPAQETTGLNTLLEGYSITIEETGEVVSPAKGFRVFATENSVYSSVAVVGRQVQDAANDDRWMRMYMDFMPRDIETELAKAALLKMGAKPVDAEMWSASVVNIAWQVRKAFRSGTDGVDRPMSPRAVIRWATLLMFYRNTKNPMNEALYRAFDMPPDMAPIVENYVNVALGLNNAPQTGTNP